ncbi:MAG TPA: type II secretion system minor pseudopilin GspK [Bradyrhizobium sp.]|nr:type II secretion system minor pseudopilin GspK [Bradyrhizobium sp.]
MKRRFQHPVKTSERGFVIIAVLWILVALSALATIFSVYLSNSARALATTDTSFTTDALVSASLELTAYQLLLSDEKSRPAQGAFRFRMDKAEARVTFISEGARVDLNAAPKEMLANLFEVLGAEQKAAGEIAERIVGWRTSPKENAANGEEALYLAASLAYTPRQSDFAHVNELGLVLGVSPEMAERVLPFVTIFNKSPGVDVLIAPAEVIAALPGMTPGALDDFLKQRASLPRNQAAIASALGPAKAAAPPPKTSAFRVLTSLNFDDGRHAASEAVIVLGEAKAKEPFSILSWQDDLATGTRSFKRAGG